MKKFEIGKSYKMRSICDSNCIWKYQVIGRTEKTIKIVCEDGNVRSCRIRVLDNEELIKPLGTYSMSPSLRATNTL